VQADVYVSTPSWRRARGAAAIGDEILRSLGKHPSVSAIDRLRHFSTTIAGRRISVNGVDLDLAAERARFSLLDGDPVDVLRSARREGGVLVGEPLARRAGVWRGDRIRIYGPQDSAEFPVAGVYYDYSSENGSVFMDLGTMEASFGPGPINNVALYLAPGEDADRVVNDLRRQFAGIPLSIRSNRALRAEIISIFDQTFAVTRLLQVMSLLIAASGITLALLIMAHEQVSEIALYRALGAQRSQLFRVYLGKGLAIAAAGLMLGALGGVALALVLIFLINRSYFGWTIAWHWPWSDLARGGAIILSASFLASLYPALRASRTPASELSRNV